MGLLEPTHLILIGLVILIFFGPKQIPGLMRNLGKGMSELQKGIAESKRALTDAMEEVQREPVASPAQAEPKTPDHAAGMEASAASHEAQAGTKSENPTPVG
jgi:sec-independent protein translocase protein TatA